MKKNRRKSVGRADVKQERPEPENAMAHVLRMIASKPNLPLPFVSVVRGLFLLDNPEDKEIVNGEDGKNPLALLATTKRNDQSPTAVKTPVSDRKTRGNGAKRRPDVHESPPLLENGTIEEGGQNDIPTHNYSPIQPVADLALAPSSGENKRLRQWASKRGFAKTKVKHTWASLLDKCRMASPAWKNTILNHLRAVEDPSKVCINLGVVVGILVTQLELERAHHNQDTDKDQDENARNIVRTNENNSELYEETCQGFATPTLADQHMLRRRSFGKYGGATAATISSTARSIRKNPRIGGAGNAGFSLFSDTAVDDVIPESSESQESENTLKTPGAAGNKGVAIVDGGEFSSADCGGGGGVLRDQNCRNGLPDADLEGSERPLSASSESERCDFVDPELKDLCVSVREQTCAPQNERKSPRNPHQHEYIPVSDREQALGRESLRAETKMLRKSVFDTLTAGDDGVRNSLSGLSPPTKHQQGKAGGGRIPAMTDEGTYAGMGLTVNARVKRDGTPFIEGRGSPRTTMGTPGMKTDVGIMGMGTQGMDTDTRGMAVGTRQKELIEATRTSIIAEGMRELVDAEHAEDGCARTSHDGRTIGGLSVEERWTNVEPSLSSVRQYLGQRERQGQREEATSEPAASPTGLVMDLTEFTLDDEMQQKDQPRQDEEDQQQQLQPECRKNIAISLALHVLDLLTDRRGEVAPDVAQTLLKKTRNMLHNVFKRRGCIVSRCNPGPPFLWPMSPTERFSGVKSTDAWGYGSLEFGSGQASEQMRGWTFNEDGMRLSREHGSCGDHILGNDSEGNDIKEVVWPDNDDRVCAWGSFLNVKLATRMAVSRRGVSGRSRDASRLKDDDRAWFLFDRMDRFAKKAAIVNTALPLSLSEDT